MFNLTVMSSTDLELGTMAPDFSLPDENNTIHTLSEYRGQKVVVYFYPKDDTPGCTKEACGIRDSYDGFKAKNIIVFGISYDNGTSHRKFIKKHNLPFHLLTDADKAVSNAYGAKGIFFPSRKTFLIDEEGRLIKIYNIVDVLNHASSILQAYSNNQ